MLKNIGKILVLLLIIGGLVFFISNKQSIPVSSSRIFMNNKLFSEGDYLQNWIVTDNPAITLLAKKLKGENEEQSLINTYNFIENNYHYVADGNVTFSDGRITITAPGDYWQSPLLTLEIIKQTGGFYGDCEDGTFLLDSLLNAEGYENVYAEIGTVSLSSGTYGHAWVIIEKDKKTFLLETTLGKPFDHLRLLPYFYHPNYKFNNKELFVYFGGNNSYPILTPEARKELISKINGEQ